MDPKDVLADPEYQNANLATKQVIFARLVAKDPAFANANAETQNEIKRAWGVLEPEPPKTSVSEPKAAEDKKTEETTNQIPRLPYVTSDTGLMLTGTGAALGAAGSFLPKVAGTSPEQIARAQERLAVAQDRLAEAQRAAASGPAGQMRTAADLQAAHEAAKAEVAIAKQELSAANQALREATRAASTAASEVVEAVPSRTVPGASGAQNWARAMATQELPESLIEQVQTMRKTGEGGAQRLIDEDLARLQKIKELGDAEHRLVGEGRGQLMLPPDEAARVEQELAQKQAAQAAEQARIAELAERDRLMREAELQRRQREARARQQTAGQRVSQTGQQAKEARALEKGVAKSQSAVNIAEQAAERAKKSGLGPFQQFGASVAKNKFLAPLLGAAGAAGTLMSADEAIRRYNEGDRSGAVISALEAIFGAMSMVPARNPLTAGIKGVGTVGGLAMSGGELGKYLYNMYNEPSSPDQR
jgi:hypothetical protein